MDPKVDEESYVQIGKTGTNDAPEQQQQMMKFPRTCSLTHLMELEYFGPISQLMSDNPYNLNYDFQNTMGNNTNAGQPDGRVEKLELGEMPYQYTDSGKFQVNQSSILNQQLFVNPMVYEFQ